VGRILGVTCVAALLSLSDCSALPNPQTSGSRNSNECSNLPSVNGNAEILRCLRVLGTDPCSANGVKASTLAARYDIRSGDGWTLLRESLVADDPKQRLVAWRILRPWIGEGFARDAIQKDRELEQVLVASLRSKTVDCPSARTAECEGGTEFYVEERFTDLVASATILSLYQAPEVDTAVADLSTCPEVLPWLVESGAFDHLTEARERALISRLLKTPPGKQVDAILDVLELRGDALAATLLEECQKKSEDIGQKCRITAVAIRERLSQTN
jgi:hypothetical protein